MFGFEARGCADYTPSKYKGSSAGGIIPWHWPDATNRRYRKLDPKGTYFAHPWYLSQVPQVVLVEKIRHVEKCQISPYAVVSGPVWYVLKIHLNVELGPQMIQFNIHSKSKSEIFIQTKNLIIYSTKYSLKNPWLFIQQNIHSTTTNSVSHRASCVAIYAVWLQNLFCHNSLDFVWRKIEL